MDLQHRLMIDLNDSISKSRRIQAGQDPATYNPFQVRNKTPHQLLNSLRSRVEHIDYDIHKLLMSRFDLTNEIGQIKKENGLPIENLEVETIKLAAIDPKLKSIYQEIFKVSKQCQNTIE